MKELPGECPLCETLDVQPVYVDTHVSNGISYKLYECKKCTGQWWEPFHNPGANWYEHDERYADRNQDPILEPNAKHLDVIGYLRGREGKVLDVGCGTGNFLAYAIERGWEGWGIDFDRDAIEAGKKSLGLSNLEVADLGQFHRIHPELRFDLVTFFDVFEHIDNHNEFLGQARGLLTPHGALALSVPYRHGWPWLMQQDFPPRHLTRWDEKSITSVLERGGFRITKLWRHPASFNFLLMKIRFRYGSWASIGLVRKVRSQEESVVTEAGMRPTPSAKASAVHALARTKDVILFGVPALILWLLLLPHRGRYTDFYLVAEPIDTHG